MALRAEYAMHQSDLGDFLSEAIWEERNGSMLSIMSAFARLDMDPWQEAARLAAMPRDAAAEALAKVLARLPPSGPEQPDRMALARRLVEVLPKRYAPGPATPQGQREGNAGRSALKMNVMLLVAFAAGLAILQVIEQLF